MQGAVMCPVRTVFCHKMATLKNSSVCIDFVFKLGKMVRKGVQQWTELKIFNTFSNFISGVKSFNNDGHSEYPSTSKTDIHEA
jgi:hypothetical protein